jgi:hypothetical protein
MENESEQLLIITEIKDLSGQQYEAEQYAMLLGGWQADAIEKYIERGNRIDSLRIKLADIRAA